MTTALILHTVPNALHCIRHGLHRNKLLFSTHPSVDIFLEELHHIKCSCLSRFLENKDILIMKDDASDKVDNLLHTLDREITPEINRQYGFNMRYFTPLYSYLGKYHYFRTACIVEIIKRIIEKYALAEIILYDAPLNQFINCRGTFGELLPRFFKGMQFNIFHQTGYAKSSNILSMTDTVMQPIRMVVREPSRILGRAAELLGFYFSSKRFKPERRTILLHERLYDLQCIVKDLRKYNLLYFLPGSVSPLGFKMKRSKQSKVQNDRKFDLIDGNGSGNLLDTMFLEDVSEDFSKHVSAYLESVEYLARIKQRYDIRAGIWGNPPISGLKALIFEYLRSENIPIIGAQHGSVYGDSYKPWHFDSDFNRCNHFLSYGFTEGDLFRLYPEESIHCEIHPVGKTRLPSHKRKKKHIDILFPITNSLSVIAEGLSRIRPHELADRQFALVEYLDSLRNFDIYIKPIPYPQNDNFCLLPTIKRLRHAKIIYDMSLEYFLMKYYPRIVLIEFPSTPLFEVLPLDTEIFLMNDPVQPFERKALDELRLRVHYCEDVDEAISKIDSFLKGELAKKRDGTFLNHYVQKKNPKDNIIRIIDHVVSRN